MNVEGFLCFIIVFCTSLLISGIALCAISLEQYGFGIYVALIAFVGLVISLAFCVMGEEGSNETIAKSLWLRFKLNRHHQHDQTTYDSWLMTRKGPAESSDEAVV